MAPQPRIGPKEERLIFAPTVEALLLRGVRDRMTPALEAEVRALGIDLRKPLLPAYPVPMWLDTLGLVARTLHPELPMGQAQYRLGESTVTGWEYTLVGKAMFTVARLYGPRRVLLRYPTMARSSNNFLSMEALERSPTEVELGCAPFTGWPEFFQGNLQAVARLAGAREPRIKVVEHDGAAERLVLRARWQAE